MNVFLLTQEDAFYIPRLIDVFMREKPDSARVVGAALTKGEIQPKNAKAYLNFLGLAAFLKIGAAYAAYRVMDLVSRVLPLNRAYSVEAALKRHGIPVHFPENVNDPAFLDLLRDQEVDLVVSIACPQIVRRALLDFPPKGCINIHGALLPKYRGRMPSFWVLAHGEAQTGVTVHYMNEKVDDGPIIVQRTVPIEPDDTLHTLVLRSKVGFGGQALAEAVDLIARDAVEAIENDREQATYFSFPTDEAVAEFRRRGRRFR